MDPEIGVRVHIKHGDEEWDNRDFGGKKTRFDFGVSGSPVQDEFIEVLPSDLYSEEKGYGWDTYSPNGIDRGAGSGGPYDDVEQDIAYAASDISFIVDVENGIYTVRVYFGDTYAHGAMDVYAEDLLKLTGISHAANEWFTEDFVIEVVDGQLNLRFHTDGSVDPNWTIDGFEIIEGVFGGVNELKNLVEVDWDKKLSYAFSGFELKLFSRAGYYKNRFSRGDEVTIYHYKRANPEQEKEYIFGLIEEVEVEEKAPNEDYVTIEGSGYLVRLADVLHKKRTIYKDQECSSLIKYMVDSARDAGEIDITTGGVQLTDTVIPEIDFPYMPLLKGLQKIKKLATNAEGKFYDLRVKHKDLQFAVKASANTVLALPFNEGTGGTAYDHSGEGNDGTLKPSYPSNCPDWVDGEIPGEKALEFNGVDDLVEVPHDDSLNLTGSFTIDLKILIPTDAAASEQVLISKGVWEAGNVQVLKMADHKIGFNRTAWANTVVGTTPLNDGKWHRIKAIYDADSEMAYVYVDDEIENSGTRSVETGTNTHALTIGKRADCCPFRGKIANAKIYKSPLFLVGLEDLNITKVKRRSTEVKYRVFVSGAVEPYPEGGDLCEGNAKNIEVQKCYANACDILAGSQVSGDYTKTFASDDVYHRLRTQSMLYNTPITQPSFEGSGGWAYSENDPGGCFGGYRTSGWATHGAYSYCLRYYDNPPVGTGWYGMISQGVDLTLIKKIVFDGRGPTWVDYGIWSLEFLIDGTIKWQKQIEGPGSLGTHYNQSYDLSGYSGSHQLRFKLRCVNPDWCQSAGRDFYTWFDNIRLYTEFLKMIYHFKTGLDKTNVTQVKIHVEGHASAGSFPFYVYNYATSSWESIGSIASGADNSITHTITVNPGNYMDASGKMKIKTESKYGNTRDLYVDYAYIEVTAVANPLPDSEVWDCTNGLRDDDADSMVGGYSVNYNRDNLGLEGKFFFNKSKNLNWDLREADEGLRRVDFWLKSDHNHTLKLRLHRTYGNYWERSLVIKEANAWQHFQFETGEKSTGWTWNGAGMGWDGINTFEIVVTDAETDVVKIDAFHKETPIMIKAEDTNLINTYGLREKEPVDGGTESKEGAQQIADRLLALLKDPKIQIEAKGRLRMDVDLGDVVPFDRPDSDLYGNFMIYEMQVHHPAVGLSEVSYTFGSESPSLEAELASLQGRA